MPIEAHVHTSTFQEPDMCTGNMGCLFFREKKTTLPEKARLEEVEYHLGFRKWIGQ